MNKRIAKKIGSYPYDKTKQLQDSGPYTKAQHVERIGIQRRLGRKNQYKWVLCLRPRTFRSAWRPGLQGEAFYGPNRKSSHGNGRWDKRPCPA